MPWNHQGEVDRELVAAVPQSGRSAIDDARSLRDKAADSWDIAKRNAEIAKDQLRVARKESDVADAEKEKSDASVQLAEKGTTEELAKAKELQHEQKLIQKSVIERIQWRESDVERAEARVNLAECKLALAESHVELARAEAVRDLDRPEAKKVDVNDYEYAVRKHEKAVALAEIEVESVEREARIAREKFDTSIRAVPASYKKRSEKLDAEIEYRDDGYKARKGSGVTQN
jgi:hypothetical protein